MLPGDITCRCYVVHACDESIYVCLFPHSSHVQCCNMYFFVVSLLRCCALFICWILSNRNVLCPPLIYPPSFAFRSDLSICCAWVPLDFQGPIYRRGSGQFPFLNRHVCVQTSGKGSGLFVSSNVFFMAALCCIR